MVVSDFNGGAVSYSKGQIVLYHGEIYPVEPGRDNSVQARDKVTVEIPRIPEQIEAEKARGSFIRTIGTMVNVPRRYVEEVRVS